MNNVSKGKITIGYVLLLAVLLFALSMVYREMEHLMSSDSDDLLQTDSLISLLKEKDENTVHLLHTLSEANENLISPHDIERVIAEQDSVIAQQRVRHSVIARRDTILTKPKKKGFFRRLGEVFVPPKKDTAVQVKTSLEFATDTLLDAYNPADSLQEKLQHVTRQKKAGFKAIQTQKRTIQRFNTILNARIDSLLEGYEQGSLERAREEAALQRSVRHHSANIIGGIALGAVLLAGIFLILIWRDITRSNRYRKELEEANRRAEDLLASREKLMLTITHDFKAPLGSIMGYADLLSRLTVDERQRFYLGNMKSSSEHLLKLVSDLIEFHRLDLKKAEVNRVTFHPSHLLREIEVSFEPLATAKGLFLHYDVDAGLDGTFISDPLRLRQIITNLLSNAVKFTEHGGITLTARYVAGGDSFLSGNHLKLSVSDTGRGMGTDDRERIFQEFTRLPGAQGEEGFGLGLSIVRMLVQLMEGNIQVESELGKGSTFILSLPLYPVVIDSSDGEDGSKSSQELATPEPPSSDTATSGLFYPRQVLLIDDDRIQLALTVDMLSHQGISAVSCLQLDELLEALRTQRFDVLLTDVQMPALNGFELLKLLRHSNIPQAKSIPIIAVTARSEMETEEFLKHGFAGCLHKPFTVDELASVVCGINQSNASREWFPDTDLQEKNPHEKKNKNSLDFSAFNTYSSNDSIAANSILDSFIAETRLNIEALSQALEVEDLKRIAAIAHKMLPVFTLLNATQLVCLLKEMETAGETSFGKETKEKVGVIIGLMNNVIIAAQAEHPS